MRIWSTAFTCGLALITMSETAVAAAPSGDIAIASNVSAPAHPEYQIQEICACDGVAMNAFGQVTGSMVVPGGESHAFIWDPITEQLLDIGTLGGNGSFARAINARGQIAGDAHDTNGNSRAFFWDPATDLMKDLGTLGGANSFGVDINEAGQIAGTSEAATSDDNPFGANRAFFWDPITREMQNVGSLNSSFESSADAINDSGYIVGHSPPTPREGEEFKHSSTFIWNPKTKTMTEIPVFGGNNGPHDNTLGININDEGQVVGWAYNTVTSQAAAFRWNTKDNTTNFPGTLGEEHAIGWAINEGGQITGRDLSLAPETTVGDHAFFWDPSKGIVRDLGVLGVPIANGAYTYSEGVAINNAGEITGTSSTTDGAYPWHAFLWDGQTMRDLNALVAADDPLIGLVTLEAGVAINDAGRILVSGVDNRNGEQHSYLLTPRTTPFARLSSRTNIDLRPVHSKDWFDTLAPFTLGADSNGIAPLKEPVTIQIGTFSTTIPARSFKLINGDFTFNGRINAVKLYARIRLIKGKSYELFTYANCASLTGTSNPVRVSLTIGDDSGSAMVTAKFGPRPN